MKFSLRYKILIIIIILISLVTVSISIIVLRKVNERITEEIILRGKVLVSNLASDVADPLSREDDIDPPLLQKEVMENEGVLYCYIVDDEGRIRAPTSEWMEEYELPDGLEKVRGDDILIQPYTNQDGIDVLDMSAPVIFGGKMRVGTVYVGISQEPLQIAIAQMRNAIIIISGIVLLLGIVLSFVLSHFITRHINSLVVGAEKIGKGRFETRVDVKTRDEIGELALAFNEMAESLEKKEMIEGAFRRYVSHQIADQILKDPSSYIESLKGIRKEITVLFADIRGFTTKAEKLDPELVVKFLNQYLTNMTKAVFKYEGTLDKFTGDGIMAIFGAPLDQPDSTIRAIKSAMEIQAQADNLNKERIKSGDEPLYIGIGINAGEVVVGNIGYEDRLDYTVIGDAVNLASRLVDIANGREVLIGENAYIKVKDKVYAEPIGVKSVRGREDTVNVYKLKYLLE